MIIKALLGMCSPAGPGARLSILVFHRVLPVPDPLFPNEIHSARFGQILGWLGRWCRVLPLAVAIKQLVSGTLPARAVAITFDDGYMDNCTTALPILVRHRMHATFFVATGFLNGGRMWNDTLIESLRTATAIEIDSGQPDFGKIPIGSVEQKRDACFRLIRAVKHLPPHEREEAVSRIARACAGKLSDDLMMTNAQVCSLRDAGMDIGAHTVTHPILAALDESNVLREITQSRACLEHLLGERVGLFAYPNGKLEQDYTTTHVHMVEALGFDAAVSTNWGAAHAGSNLYQLPRFTPWDKGRFRFGMRMATNMLQRGSVMAGGRAESR